MKTKHLLSLLFLVCLQFVHAQTNDFQGRSLVPKYRYVMEKNDQSPTGYVMTPVANDDFSAYNQLVRSVFGAKAYATDELPMIEEEVNGVMTVRRMTPVEAARRVRDLSETLADEHIITSYTKEGVAMTFRVISEEEKTCQVGIENQNSAGGSDAAIDRSYDGTVTIPETVDGYKVVTIGNGAFYYCRNLKGVNIPNTVKAINFYAFGYCESLQSLNIPASVEEINEFILNHGNSLESIVVDAANNVYDSRQNCNAIIRTSDNYLMTGCKNTVMLNGIKGIGGGAFNHCLPLTTLYISATVNNIHGQCLDGCISLKTIKVDKANAALDSRNDCNAIIRTYDNMLLQGCSSTVIPESVTGISWCAFADQSTMEEITLPKNIKSIGFRAFEACRALKKIVAWMPEPFAITEDVFTIYYGKFNDEATLYVPKGTKEAYQSTEGWSLFTKVFEMNSGPDDIVVDEDEFTALTKEGISMKFKVLSREEKTCQVGWRDGGNTYSSEQHCIDSYTSGVVTIPSVAKGYTVTEIAGAAFYWLPNVTSIVIPNTVKAIQSFAFSSLPKMESIYIPASVTSINSNALGDSEGRKTITVDAANPIYDSRNNCNAIIEKATNTLIAGCHTTVIPNTVTAIGQSAFYGCHDLTSIIIPQSVVSIGGQAFSYCYNLETLKVEDGNPVFDSRDNCNAVIQTATNKFVKGAGKSFIPESVVSIAWCAIEGNSLLEKISIPAGVTSIENYAFEYCANLKQVTSHIVNPFKIEEGVFRKSGNSYPEYLYVPKGSKDAYLATSAWNKFTTIVELGSESVIDINPLPQNGTDFSKSMVDENGNATDLSNTEVDDVLFTLNTDNGDGYDVSEGCVVVNTPMTDEAVDNLDLSMVGTPEFAAQFTGMVFAVTAGRGSISINMQTLGNHKLGVKIGGGAAIKIAHPNRNTVVINYNVESDTYVLVYALANDESRGGTRRASSDSNSLKIFSIGWERTGDYIIVKNGDVNCDLAVNVADISSVIDVMAMNGNNQLADVNKDGKVNVADIAAIIDIMAGNGTDDTPSTGQAPKDVEAVDLGLPSGTKWANMNVGAEKPEDNGLYFAWGETVGYGSDTSDGRSFDWASYKWCNGSNKAQTKYCINSSYGSVDNNTELDLEDDAARANWGGQWVMPTYEELCELINNTTSEWTTQNGVNGRKYTSKKNGNSIFLPAGGGRVGSSLVNLTTNGLYWTSSVSYGDPDDACRLNFYSGGSLTGNDYDRRSGQTVRPVLRK